MPSLRLLTSAADERGFLGGSDNMTALAVFIAYSAGLDKTVEFSLIALGNAVELNMPRLRKIRFIIKRDTQTVRVRDYGFRKTLERLGVDLSQSISPKIAKADDRAEKKGEPVTIPDGFYYDTFLTPAEAEDHEFLPVKLDEGGS